MIKTKNKSREASKERAFANIGVRSFLTVVVILCAALIFSGALSHILPGGSFERDADGNILLDTYVETETEGISPWRVLTAPIRVFASEDSLTVIMISLFLLIMSGVFNLLEKTGGIRIFIARIMRAMRDKNGPVVCVTVLIFMLFGSFFGLFEELVTLLPIVVVFMLSLGMDTMTGLGACLLASCFGFSAAITNPFSVGLAAKVAGVAPGTGMWLRIAFFPVVYTALCVFLMLHLRKIAKDPTSSPSYEADLIKKESLSSSLTEATEKDEKIFRVYSVFFAIQIVVLILIASIRAISSYAIPILALSFLSAGLVSGLIVSDRAADVWRHFGKGIVAMLPAVFMIALASSVNLVMIEGGVIDPIMHRVIQLLDGKNRFLAVLLIYALILFLQIFIGSATAKIFLVMPIVVPVCAALGISPAMVILAYCMADGFTDVILPTNPVLLVGLSMANVSYGKWVKWTWKLQLVLLVLSLATLMLGLAIGY